MKVDYLIVGSGLTGSTIARILQDAGREVLVVDRRSCIGGNVYDYVHKSNVRIHAYGPHFFRTSSNRIWEFVNRFSTFFKYEQIIKSYIDGDYINWPVTAEYIDRTLRKKWMPEFKGEPTNFEEASLSMMPRPIYEKFVRNYTEKQWGMPARLLSVGLTERFRVCSDNDARLSQHKYQGIPEDGYAAFMANMLSDIPVKLKFNYLKNLRSVKYAKMLIFTGPIDEFFSFKYGRLSYRGQARKHTYLADISQYQPYSVVNYPRKDTHYIRKIEWKHIVPGRETSRIRGTVVTEETPISPKDSNAYEYPFPDNINRKLYLRYKKQAESIPDLLMCGRLGEYRYYDMDQAIAQAMVLARMILNGKT